MSNRGASGPHRGIITVTLLALAMSLCAGCVAPTRTDPPLRVATAWRAPSELEEPRGEGAAPRAPIINAPKASSPNGSGPSETDGAPDKTDEAPLPPSKRWHLDLAFRGSHNKFASTKQQLDRRLDLPLKTDVFGVFDYPYTPIDRKTDLGMTTWYAGVGREENTHLVWTYYVGAGAGKDINHQRFLYQTLEVDFKYGYYYTGITAEYYPWEVPAVPAAPSWEQRLRTSRPFLLAGFESGYVSAEGEGDYTVSGVNAYHDELKIRDWLFSCLLGLGWALPLDDHWSINLSGDYKFHFYRPEEYNGWNVTTAVRYRF